MRQTSDKAQVEQFDGMRISRQGRLRGHVAGFKAAKRVWTCKDCGFQRFDSPYDADGCSRKRPAWCTPCGSKAWAYSASLAEAKRYTELRMLEKIGQVRQLAHPAPTLPIKIPSLHRGPESVLVTVRTYTADFAYQQRDDIGEWTDVLEDHKPRAELTDLAKFVHTCIWEQYGQRVRVSYYRGNRLYFARSDSD